MKKIVRQTGKRAGILAELFTFLWKAKLYWLIPIIVVLVVFCALVFLAQSSAVAPFIYTLF
jgi:hypothetical protein